MLRHLRALTGHLWGISALWLLALALCLAGWSLLGGSSGTRLAERVAHAGEIASVELAPGLLRSAAPTLAPQVRALLVRQDIGFAWLRVRDAQGRAIAAAGRLESGALDRHLYPLISTEHRAPLIHNGIEVGTLEFGLLIGGGGFGGAGSRLAFGLLALLFGVPALLLLSLRLKGAFLADWSDRGRLVAHAAVRRQPALRPASRAMPALSPAAGELMAVFDRAGVVVDRDLIVCDFNKQAERLTGWSRDQVCGQHLSKVLVLTESEAQRPLRPALDACLRGTRSRVQDLYSLQARDGVVRAVDIDAGPLRDPTGRIGGVLLTMRQVETKLPYGLQRMAPTALLASPQDPRQLSQMLLDQVLECVITTDSQDRIQFANGRALENFGYNLVELRGEHISRLLPGPFQHAPRLRIADFALTPFEQPSTESVARRRDGSEYPAALVIHAVNFRGQQGHVIAVRPAVPPAGSPVLSPALQHLLDNALEEVYVIDRDTLQLVAGNRHALRNLGFQPGQLAELTLLQLCPRLTPAQLQAQMIHLLPGEAGRASFNTWLQRADGSSYEVQARLDLWSVEPPPVLLLVSQALGALPHHQDVAHREDKLGFLA
ncbi:MAG: PAS domain S-box protein, partial [Nevskiales bacterium]